MDESQRKQHGPEEQAGHDRPREHLELRGSVQPALVLAQPLPVLGLPDYFVDGLQDPSAAGLSSLQQGEVCCTSCGEENRFLPTILCTFVLFDNIIWKLFPKFSPSVCLMILSSSRGYLVILCISDTSRSFSCSLRQ